jgi:hypothetical protein
MLNHERYQTMPMDSESNDDLHFYDSIDTNTKKYNESVAFAKFELCPHWVKCVAAYFDKNGDFLKNNDFWNDVFNEDVNDRINQLHYENHQKLTLHLTWVPNPEKFKFFNDSSEFAIKHNHDLIVNQRRVLDMELTKGIFAFKIYRVDNESLDNTHDVPSIEELVDQFNL